MSTVPRTNRNIEYRKLENFNKNVRSKYRDNKLNLQTILDTGHTVKVESTNKQRLSQVPTASVPKGSQNVYLR